jgi:DMSO reductase anchor subunit
MDKTFDKNFVAKAIYGLISVLAGLLIMEEHRPTAWKAAGLLFGTVLVLAMAETYSATIAETLQGKRDWIVKRFWRSGMTPVPFF